jgi:hypothetical protein
MSKRTISKNKYYQLYGLFMLAKAYHERLADITESSLSITEEEVTDMGSLTEDAIWDDQSVDRLLNKLEIEVEQ